MSVKIRNEVEKDYLNVEEITRKAFWNIHTPGCNEHLLVHKMRNHPDFIKELALVIEDNNVVIGNIMYTKASLTDKDGNIKEILTFGPVSILPKYQRKGYGRKLIEYSMNKAKLLKYDVIVIFGNPSNYVSLGFKSCRKYNISIEGSFPTAMLVYELNENSLDGRAWYYNESEVYNLDERDLETFDSKFEHMEKKVTPSQEEFYILSNSRLFN